MKLKFEVEGERIEDLTPYVRGPDWYCAILALDEWLRQRIKYSQINGERLEETQNTRHELHSILTEKGLEL